MRPSAVLKNERGAVMNIALLLLLLLSLVVISLSRLSSTNLKIAAFDRQSKTSFQNADSGVELAVRIIEESLGCPAGLPETAPGPHTTVIADLQINKKPDPPPPAVATRYLDPWLFTYPVTAPTDAARDIFFPNNLGANEPHTNITVAGLATLNEGCGLTMIAGYEDLGKAAVGGGSRIDYTIWSHHLGKANSQSIIKAGWRHIIGMQGTCNYE